MATTTTTTTAPIPSFIAVPADSDFPPENIPFGVISSTHDASPRPATIVGDHVIDIRALALAGLFTGPLLGPVAAKVFSEPTLNAFMALSRPAWREARTTIQSLLHPSSPLATNPDLRKKAVIPRADTRNHLPAAIGDYTDFYASKEHATNVGVMFRGKDNALQPNWVHLPVGYHGRASSVVVSGTDIRRPCGLLQDFATKSVSYGACAKLDYELEMAFFVGVGNKLGEPIDIEKADEHIFGMVLMNDWSARDIQAFEYVPLGPFLGKNFGTVISPWIVTLDALESFRVPQPPQEPTPAKYLRDAHSLADAYDIHLTATVQPKDSNKEYTISKTNFKYMYWTFKQMLAHHTVNGCNMQPGDLCGSGTISGPDVTSVGSLLEASTNGKAPLAIGDGLTRSFFADGDTVRIRGHAEGTVGERRVRVGFGVCESGIVPAAPRS
ncbi:hypothetical protein DFJ73DRAFT_833436 [Zopfochytrium polystomum]|nr:hypothetical protein DFJ73DRAFT_833436 [Zopfochytrium polystomum]